MASEPDDTGVEERMALERARSSLLRARPKPVHVGRYQLLERIGRGASATVWRAHDPDLDREVALKLVARWAGLGGSSDEARARVIREAQTVAALDHPHIVPIYDAGRYDAGTAGEGVFLAMALLTGTSMRAWLAKKKRSIEDILAVFDQAAAALEAAHRAGVVHRDFKPSNAVVSETGRLHVIDFGLARLVDSGPSAEEVGSEPFRNVDESLTHTGSVMGTPAFMSPEQHEGKAVGPASDQYSFCVSLFQGLTGDRPFRGGDLNSLARAKQRGDIDNTELAHVPAGLRRAILRGLRPDPADRWPDMTALRRAINAKPRGAFFYVGAGAAVVGIAALGLLAAGAPDAALPTATAAPQPNGRTDPRWRSLTESQELRTLGKFAAAGAVVDGLLAELDASENSALWAAAMLERASILRFHGHATESAVRFDQAFTAASEADASDLAFQAAEGLTLFAFDRNPSGVDRWLGQAEAAVERGLLGPRPQARLLALQAQRAEDRWQLAEADVLLRRAETLLADVDDVDAQLRIGTQHARVAGRLGRFEQYSEGLERVVTLGERELGSSNPRILELWINLAEFNAFAGRLDEAAGIVERAIAVGTAALGSEHALVGRAWTSLAVVQGEIMNYERSLDAYDEAERIASKSLTTADRDLQLARVWMARGLVLHEMGRSDEGLVQLKRARDQQTRVLGADHFHVALNANNIALVLHTMGRLDEAEHEARAVAQRFKTLPVGDPSVRAFAYNRLARILMDAGRDREARDWVLESVKTWEGVGGVRNDQPAAYFLAARASASFDPEAARSYADLAIEGLPPNDARTQIVDDFVDSLPPTKKEFVQTVPQDG